jgi:peptidyl-prolyl cis-trans isomerase D
MATLEKLRNRAGTLVAVVIGLALLAFILGDLFGSGGSLFTKNQFEIAEISGKSIPYQHYQERIDQITELNKASRKQTSLDEQTVENIREEVWNEIVQESVLGNKYKSLGIAISTEELFDMVQGRKLHPIIRQEFGDRQTGEVNPAMIVQFLKSLDSDPSGLQRAIWLYLENLIIKDRLFSKYNNLINKGMFVTDLQSSRSLNERNKRVDIDFVVARYSTISDSLVSVKESELKDYYKKHKHEFKQDASRDVAYVVFPIVPSQDDFTVAEEWINKIKNDFASASDAAQFTNLNSDTPFNNKFFSKTQLPTVELGEWAFNAKTDEVFGPIFDGDSYMLARLVDVAFLPDSVKARHILIGTQQAQSQEEYNLAKAQADSLLNVVKRNRNFAELARKFSQDPGSASEGGDLGWFPEGVMVQPFNDACFNGNKGEIVIVETQFGFHIIEILDRAQPSKKVKVALLERTVGASTRTYQRIYQEASVFAGINNTSEKFEAGVQEKRLSKRIASNLKEADRRIAGLDNPREMVRWAYRSKENAVSPVFEFGENFVVATLTRVREEGNTPFKQVEDEIKSRLIRDKKAEILIKKFNDAMATSSSIQDLSAKLVLLVQDAPRVTFSSFSLPVVGFEPAVIASAVSANEGELTGPVKGNSGVYALTVNAINFEEGDASIESSRLLNIYKARSSREAYEAIKENAKIKDSRSKFF